MSNDSSLFGVSRWYYKHTHPNGGNVCFTHGGIWTLIIRFRQFQTWIWSCTSASGAASCAAGCDDVDASPRRTLCQIALLRFGNSIRCFWIQGLPGVPELLQMGTPIKWERPFIGIYRKTREVQLAAGWRQVAQTVPFIDAQIFCNSHSS